MSRMPNQPPEDASRAEIMSALFAQMVLQQGNMALMFLGKMPNPADGKPLLDIPSAKIFIDQLEMLEFKTRGNLNSEEEKLLRQSLTSLRLAFVEAIEAQHQESPPSEPPQEAAAQSATSESPVPEPPKEEPESRKRYTKKY